MLSISCIGQWVLALYAWEGICRSGVVALAVHHRLRARCTNVVHDLIQLNLDQKLNQVHAELRCTKLNSDQLIPFS